MGEKLVNLQALRGLACLMVVGFHLHCQEVGIIPHCHDWLGPVFRFGYAGVDLFFALSGFIITWVHADRLGDRRQLPLYAFRRAWRIYPAYWLCWLAGGSLLVGVFGDLRPESLGQVLGALALIRTDPPYVPQAWTLVYEVMFYAVFAVFFLLPRRWFVPMLALWAAAIVYTNRHGVVSMQDHWMPLRLPVLEFLAGCFAALAVGRGWGRGGTWWAIAALGWMVGGAVLSATGHLSPHADVWGRVLMFGLPSAVLVFGLAAAERDGARPLPVWMQHTGDASYAMYLSHVAAIQVSTFVACSNAWNFWNRPKYALWLFGTYAFAVAVGFAFHRWFEKPLLSIGRRKKRSPTREAEPELRRAA